MSPSRAIIPGSTLSPSPAAHFSRAPDPSRTLEVSIVLRRPTDPPASGSREDVEQSLCASPADIDAVSNFARDSGLIVVEVSAARRTIRVQGTVAQLQQAFGATLHMATADPNEAYVTYEGPLTVPSDLDGIVVAVLGLDQRPIARSG